MIAQFLLLAALMSASVGRADVADMTKFFEHEAQSLNEALALPDEPAPQDDLYLRRMSFRVRPKVAFGISSVLKLEIIPEAEFIWQKQLPDGWTTYKP